MKIMCNHKRLRILLLCLILPFTLSGQAVGLAWVRGILRNPNKVGAIAPCSSYTAKELTRYIYHNRKKKVLRILEVGAGTGAVTKEIVSKLKKDDQLDVVELDQNYCTLLHEKFGQQSNVAIHCISITDFVSDAPYDLIISTLPFNSLPTELFQQVVHHYTNLIKPGGHIAYIEYVGLANVKRLMLTKQERESFDKKCAVLKQWRTMNGVHTEVVVRNLPPAYVYHLHIPKEK